MIIKIVSAGAGRPPKNDFGWRRTAAQESHSGEIEKFIIRQPPIGEEDEYDSENSWISDGLPSSSRRSRRGDGRWEVGEWKEVKCKRDRFQAILKKLGLAPFVDGQSAISPFLCGLHTNVQFAITN